jgi:hypothetical protein
MPMQHSHTTKAGVKIEKHVATRPTTTTASSNVTFANALFPLQYASVACMVQRGSGVSV